MGPIDSSFLIYRAAREITPTRLVICRADLGAHEWALRLPAITVRHTQGHLFISTTRLEFFLAVAVSTLMLYNITT